MRQNVGGLDRYARIAVGVILVLVGTVGVNSLILTVVGLVVMGTGVFRFCGLYSLLGINTACKMKPKNDEKKTEEA